MQKKRKISIINPMYLFLLTIPCSIFASRTILEIRSLIL